MKNILSYFSLLLALMLTSNTFAQNIGYEDDIRSDLNNLFLNIDKSRISTGFLKEYAVETIDMFQYGGQLSDSNYVDLSTFESILKTLKSSTVRNTSLSTVDVADVIRTMSGSRDDDLVNVGIIAYKYNFIKPNAVENGLILFAGGQASDAFDADGNWLDPYDEAYVVAFAPDRFLINDRSIEFDFDNYLFTNLAISTVELDYGDGYSLVSGSEQVLLPEGLVDLNLRITLNDGTVLLSHSKVNVMGVRMDLQDEDFDVRADFCDSTLYMGLESEATITIDFIDGNAALTKPFIVVEGFDPVGIAQLISEDLENGFCSIQNFRGSLSAEIENNYDIIYVDWKNSESYIQGNANCLIEIIRWVNAHKTTDEKNIVYGHSMGGLIARYALRKMELAFEPHDVSVYISHDTPHLGANLPLGFQYALYDILSFFEMNFIDEERDIFLSYLHSPSARQMLMHYVDENGVIDNSMHNSWLLDLRQVGFPEGDSRAEPIRNIAISNGGDFSAPNMLARASMGHSFKRWGIIAALGTLLADAWDLFPIEGVFGVSFFFGGNVDIDSDLQIFPFKSSGCKVYDWKISLTKHIPAFDWAKTYGTYDSVKYAPTGVAMDDVNGSYFDLGELPDNMPDEITYADRFLFVPTVSSLCVGSHQVSLGYSDYNSVYTNADNTPFDDVYITSESTPHLMSLDTGMCNWITDNLTAVLNGPVCGVAGSEYEMHNVNAAVNWSTSDSNVATISSSGVLDVISNGYVSVYADVDFGSHVSHFEKRIMTGLPSFTLTRLRNTSVGAYTITASCSSVELDDFWELTGFKYQWGVKEETGADIVWSDIMTRYGKVDSTEDKMNLTRLVDASKSSKMLYFKISNDVYNATYSMSCPMMPTPGLVDPPILILPDGSLYIADNDAGISVRSNDANIGCVVEVPDKFTLTFGEIPSTEKFLEELLKRTEFLDLLHEMKPWGEETLKLINIKVKYFGDMDDEVETGQIIKLLYKDY